jgi:hypothetical protein
LFAISGLIGAFISLSSKKTQPHRQALTSMAMGYIIYIIVFHYLANLDMTSFLLGVQMRFWMQPNMIVYIWAGIALASLRSRLRYVVDAIAIIALAMQLSQGFRTRDFSEESSIKAYGESILESLPPNALVLLNGDLNNNAVKYLVGCERQRLDLRVISLQLMSWDWFVSTQARHYPKVIFPGEVYHPYKKNGFSIAQFLDANYGQFPLYLCGSWKDGDDSHQYLYEVNLIFASIYWIFSSI